MNGALDGLKVLDFSTLVPGPMASLFLADAGADVVKVERPDGGDEMRSYAPKWGADSINFSLLNRGKKSITVDLKSSRAFTLLEPLIREADVVIEQFRPGVMNRLGLGYDDMSSINAEIVYCSISGYGQNGPKADRAGHDLNYIGDVGLLALSYGSLEQPVLPPGLIADIAGGTYPALLNILLALRARDAGKGGAHLDISMTANLFPFTYWAFGNGQAANEWPGNGDGLVTGASPRYQLYPTADGKLLAAAPLEEKFWNRFCSAIDLAPDLHDDSLDPVATRAAIARIIGSRPASYWVSVFESADCCCSIVQTVREALQDRQFADQGVFSRQLLNGDGEKLAALPTPIVASLAADSDGAAAAPGAGQHQAELMASSELHVTKD